VYFFRSTWNSWRIPQEFHLLSKKIPGNENEFSIEFLGNLLEMGIPLDLE
jgi:hypothetical protein